MRSIAIRIKCKNVKDNQEMKDLTTNIGNKLLNADVNGVVLGSVLEGLDVLYIRILDEDIHRNCAKGGYTCIWGSYLPLPKKRTMALL